MAIPEIGEDVPLDYGRKRIPAIGEDVPIIDPGLLAVTDMPEVKESIPQSAIKDFKQVAGGLWELGKAAGYAVVPSEENTLLKIGKYMEEAYNKGELDDNAWAFTKEAIIAPLRNLGKDISPIIEEGVIKGTPQAAENIARRPFSFVMDVLSTVGLGKAAVGGTKLATSVATGKRMADITRRVEQAGVIAKAKTAEDIVDDLPTIFETLDDKIRVAADNAKAVLPKDPKVGFTTKEVIAKLDDAKAKVGKPISDASINAVESLDKYKERILKVYKNENISAPELKQIIMDLDDDIDWNTPKSQKSNSAIKGLRREVDTMLKGKFPNYEERMAPLADLMNTREEASKLLKVVRRQGEWEVPDIAGSRIDRLFKGTAPKAKTADVLSKLDSVTGSNIVEDMGATTFVKRFEQPVNEATRNVLTGTVLGGWLGGIPGAGAGAAIANTLDKYGGRAISTAVDAAPKAFNVVGDIAKAVPAKTMAVPILGEAIRQEGQMPNE